MIDLGLSEKNLNEFINTEFGKTVRLFEGTSSLYKRFSSTEVEQYLIGLEGHLHKYVMIYGGASAPFPHANTNFFTESQNTILRKSLNSGASLKIEQLERRHPDISKICRSIENRLGGESWAKVFWTPANQKGLDIHFDTTAVFCFQLEGSKRWRVWDELEFNPTKPMSKVLKIDELNNPIMDIILKPGDVLYMPAGFPHCTFALDEPSLSVSISHSAPKLIDILMYGLEEAAKSHGFLRTPKLPSFENKGSFQKLLGEATEVIQGLDIPALERMYSASQVAGRADINSTSIFSSLIADEIEDETTVQWVESQSIELRRYEDKIIVSLPSTIIPEKPLLVGSPPYLELPNTVEDELLDITSGRISKIKDIVGGLDIPSKVLLVKTLIKYGLMRVVLV